MGIAQLRMFVGRKENGVEETNEEEETGEKVSQQRRDQRKKMRN